MGGRSGIRILEEYGFTCLTGESCVLSMRLLFDCNEIAKGILEDFLGNCINLRKGCGWNDTCKYSFMASNAMAHDLAIFCLCFYNKNPGIDYVIETPHCGLIYECKKENVDYMLDNVLREVEVKRKWKVHLKSSSRNVHRFTGREV